MYNSKKAFTLLEILVALTIFSIFMVSMIMIYASSANIDRKIEINRSMQENTKNVVETIAEDIRREWLSWVSSSALDTCNFNKNLWLYKTWDKLCIWWNISYYLALKDLGGNYIMVNSSDISAKCWDVKNECILVKKQGSDITRLSNSRIRFTNLEFLVSNENIPKVTIVYEVQPSIRKWVKYESIKNSKLNFQTTITSRLIKTN